MHTAAPAPGPSPAPHRRPAAPRTRELLAAGAVAGLLAAAAAVAFMLLAALVDDRPIEMAVRPLVAYVDADGALAALLGVAEAAALAAALGVLLAALLPWDLPLGGAAIAGAAYALTAMSFLTSVADELQDTMVPLGGSWVIAFAIFGALLGAVPALRRRRALGAGRGARAPAARPGRGGVRGEAPA